MDQAIIRATGVFKTYETGKVRVEAANAKQPTLVDY